VRSPGYIVDGLNEFYTSKKCPDCHEFVAQVTLRKLFCRNCGRYHHRDVMAAENMSNIAREYLLNQERPLYLHPVTADGRYPWVESRSPGQETAEGATVGASTTTAPIQAGGTRTRKKRSKCGTTQEKRERQGKVAKKL
ncbi:hypothetical protein BGZ79_005094, partial [Entomortierella chlamydospora]